MPSRSKKSMPSRSKTKSALSKVGYRNPPVQAQFKKGQSGNPAGRSPRPRSLTEALLEDFLASWERHGVSVSDHRHRLFKPELSAQLSVRFCSKVGCLCSRFALSPPLAWIGLVPKQNSSGGKDKLGASA